MQVLQILLLQNIDDMKGSNTGLLDEHIRHVLNPASLGQQDV